MRINSGVGHYVLEILSRKKKLFISSIPVKKTHRGTELPNTMIFFQARVDAKLLRENADKNSLKEVMAYVLPHISDDGPPPPHPSDEISGKFDSKSSAQVKSREPF